MRPDLSAALAAGTVTIRLGTGIGARELVEGVDFAVDLAAGVVTLREPLEKGSAYEWSARSAEQVRADMADLRRALQLKSRVEFDIEAGMRDFAAAMHEIKLPKWIEPREAKRRREAQWKTERRGRRP